LTLGAATPKSALANGRFPEAQRLLEFPGNPNRLYMAATFGLLATEDRGQSWYAICEEAFALKFLEGDPLLEVLPDGALLGGIYETLNRSSDCGCTWQTTLAASATETVLDITIDRRTGAVLAVVADSASLPLRFWLSESTDLGKTWHKLSDLPSTMVYAFTVDVAPSDSSRIYVSGVPRADQTTPPGLLAVSSDHGASWETRQITGSSTNAGPYIAAVDPTHPDRLYVRTDAWEDSGEFSANDALLYSDDAGRTWRELARHAAKLFGFALSPDGGTVLIGYGDPVDAGGRTTNSDEFGIYKANATTFNFEKIFTATIGCLRWTSTGLYACMTENHPEVPTPGMALGFAPNADFTLATAKPFTSLLSVKNVRGPLACNASVCTDNWKTGVDTVAPLCELLQASCTVDPSVNHLSCPAPPDGGAGGTAGTGGATGTGGTGGSGTGGTTGTAGGGGGGGGKSGGCGCSAGSVAGNGGTALIALLLLGVRRLRRRHRRHAGSGA
jgi:MYXO-CTERM domain-containing protein